MTIFTNMPHADFMKNVADDIPGPGRKKNKFVPGQQRTVEVSINDVITGAPLFPLAKFEIEYPVPRTKVYVLNGGFKLKVYKGRKYVHFVMSRKIKIPK